jgi:hypothetical protein
MKRSRSAFARQRFGKHIYKVKQSTMGTPLFSSSQSSLGVQQTVTTDKSSGTVGDGDSLIRARL